MAKRLYVGNLPFKTTEEDLKEAFSVHGEVAEVRLINDRETGRSRGFGFVEMADESVVEKVISEMDGKDFGGRRLHVNIAKEKSAA